ncbi:MAG: prenyltransferase [Dehalococcoidia bacterium]|nr:prenyltransferase [Dehalococcoidia bacterium]
MTRSPAAEPGNFPRAVQNGGEGTFPELVQKSVRQTGLWARETRPLFLSGSFALAFVGTSAARSEGSFNLQHAVLAFCGLLMWHMSVQVLNDYFDHRSGIDLRTRRTPFSGGSGILPARLLEPGAVLVFGLLTFVLALPLWAWLVARSGLLLVPVLAVGGAFVLLYTPVLARSIVPEVFSGLGLGALPVLMFYFVQTGSYGWGPAAAGIASGILIFNSHLLFEFPDVEADRVGGRRTLPIMIGRRKAGWVYLGASLTCYGWILACAILDIMPPAALLSLLTLPLALRASKGVLGYRDTAALRPALFAGAAACLFTLVLLGVGYIL